ncbi:MAG: hypothetical protein GX424_00205 [Clostridiales bacterium]|jgi:cell division protein FtsL|nr:hypothetical protein [Clostridiales bacterium]
MAARSSNEAYDFSLFEPKRQQEEPRKKDNVIKLPKERLEENRRSRLNPIRAVFGFFAMAVIVGVVSTIVYGQVQLTELTEQINQQTKTLTESQSVYTQLKMKSDSQMSLQAVENYAKSTLGMTKIEQSQVQPIELSKGDKTQVVQKGAGKNWLSSVWDSIMQFLS